MEKLLLLETSTVVRESGVAWLSIRCSGAAASALLTRVRPSQHCAGSGASAHKQPAAETKSVAAPPAASSLPPPSVDMVPPTEDELLNHPGIQLAISQVSANIPHGAAICSALTLIYGLWASAKAKKRWTAHFMWYLKTLEAELTTAQEVANNEGHIKILVSAQAGCE
jgi:hypothetical protein